MHKTNWDFNEFLAFLLIYASHADIDFSKNEEDFIRETVTDEIFEKINQHFNQLTDFQALELILSYKDVYYPTSEDKDHIFEELHKLFDVDGEFSYLEKELLTFLEKLM